MRKTTRRYECGTRHHTKTFKAGIVLKVNRTHCEECGQEFTKKNFKVLFGSCNMQICKRCWEKKL
jgi:hypothetical protein